MNTSLNAAPAEPATNKPSTRELIRNLIVTWLRDELGMPDQKVDYDTPLTELGIDSLGMASLNLALETETRKRPNEEVMYELENINQLADYLDSLPVTSSDRPLPSLNRWT